MWRFILVTFGFLGFAFWELSGGADYKPHENSIQARATQTPAVKSTALASARPEPKAETSAKALSNLQDSTGERFEITLASVKPTQDTGTAGNTARTELVEDKARFLTQPDTSEDAAVLAALGQAEEAEQQLEQNWPGAITLFEQQAEQASLRREAEAAARAAMDVRYVTASSANMRGGPGTDFNKVGRLTEGAEVAVINAPGNGWLELQVMSTGETGWMADWLVSAPAQ